MWVPAGNDRFTWDYEPDQAGTADPDRPRRLFDPGDGTLIEAEGPTLIRYPSANVDNGAIWNASGNAWVVQNSGWDARNDEEFWAQLEDAASPEHPIWDGARKTEEARTEEVPAPRHLKEKPKTEAAPAPEAAE